MSAYFNSYPNLNNFCKVFCFIKGKMLSDNTLRHSPTSPFRKIRFVVSLIVCASSACILVKAVFLIAKLILWLSGLIFKNNKICSIYISITEILKNFLMYFFCFILFCCYLKSPTFVKIVWI